MKTYPKLGGGINVIWSSNIRVKLAAGSQHLGQKEQPELPVAVLTCMTCIYSVGDRKSVV